MTDSTALSSPRRRKAIVMDQDQQTENTELVTESLVEEVSIDGMCGVY
ncbi:mycofactocin precursor MftA [Mycolicibacillus trivialis]